MKPLGPTSEHRACCFKLSAAQHAFAVRPSRFRSPLAELVQSTVTEQLVLKHEFFVKISNELCGALSKVTG
jgi:hypothetical protein